MKVKTLVKTTKHTISKHSPQILIFSGIVGTVAAGVLACRATRKLDDILEKHNDYMDGIKKALEKKEFETAEGVVEYTEKDAKQDTLTTYVQTGLDLAKLYAPSVILAGLSIASICIGNNIWRKRTAALSAAYAATAAAYKEYRSRVIKELGADVDKKIRMGDFNSEQVVETDENGNVINVEKPSIASDYGVWFEEGTSEYWEPYEDWNESFFSSRESMLHDKLVVDHVITLNDAYDALGIKKTKAGMVVGWRYDPNRKDVGDNYIRFDVSKYYEVDENGEEDLKKPKYFIDFNVDGYIFDKIKEDQKWD